MKIPLIVRQTQFTLTAVLVLLVSLAQASKSETTDSTRVSGSAPLESIIKTAIEISAGPNDIVIKGKHGLRIKVTNKSDRPVLFDGEKACAKTLSTEYKCVDIDTFDELNLIPPTFRSTLSAETGSAVNQKPPLASKPIGIGLLNSNKNVLAKLGKDAQGKNSEQERFGQRILWPGDSSEGIVLFPAEESLVGAVVTVPVCSFFNSADQASVSTTKK